VLVHANVFFALRFARPKTRGAGTGQLGPTDANETGESRGSQRDSHFDGQASATRGRCLPPCAFAETVSGTPVASSELMGSGSLLRSPLHLARRPPRPVPRGPCERRSLSRSKVPSVVRGAPQPARTEVRTNLQHLGQSHGAHVMRIAEDRPDRPSSPRARPCAHARGACPWLSPRSRAPWDNRAFDPFVTGGALHLGARRSTDFCNTCDARALTADASIPRMRLREVTTYPSLGLRPPPPGDGTG
jgi:hypothetical protein